MAKQDIVLKDVEIPAGYEPTGEFRSPNEGEFSLSEHGGIGRGKIHYSRIIVRRIEPTSIKACRMVASAHKSCYVCNEARSLAQAAIAEWEASVK